MILSAMLIGAAAAALAFRFGRSVRRGQDRALQRPVLDLKAPGTREAFQAALSRVAGADVTVEVDEAWGRVTITAQRRREAPWASA